MILSMTGYASHEMNTPSGTLLIELRSVNHRYLELQLKLDDQMRAFESVHAVKRYRLKLGRGKVDCRIALKQDQTNTQMGTLNHPAVQKIAESINVAAQYFKQVQAVNLLEVLSMPGVIRVEKPIAKPWSKH